MVGLLIISNKFMTIAWYGAAENEKQAFVMVIIPSWAIARLEYIFQVSARCLGSLN